MMVRRYGAGGPTVIVLHGGPGAPGTMAAVARGLSDMFRVIEPWQRGSDDEPLTVARHVADLHELVLNSGSPRPALVGSSWGAMLALAYAAAHPESAGPLALVGCGTFDRASRERTHAILDSRMGDSLHLRLDKLAERHPDPDKRLRAVGQMVLPIYSYDAVARELELGECDARAFHETWNNMVHMQEAGVYPAAFAAIRSPVLMLHGADDPHPGEMIRDSLAPYLPQLQYREWKRCGHYPWLEKAVREEFFLVLRTWLSEHAGTGRSPSARPRSDAA